jgi:hypothetical protein
VSSSATCLLCCGSVAPGQPRSPTFAEVVVAAHLVDCSGCSTPSHGIAGLPGKRPRAAA